MACIGCGSGRRKKVIPRTINYVLKETSTGKVVGEFGSRVQASVSKNKFPFETKIHPVKISSTEEKPEVTKKTTKKVTIKPKKES